MPLKILYISYDGSQEPIPQSQVLPYLKEFSYNGCDIYWLSFDKKHSFNSRREKRDFRNNLLKANIKWHSIAYHKRPTLLAKSYDMAYGLLFASYLVIKNNINIVHGRSEVASVIALFLKKIFKIKFIYDRRGFMAEDYVEGGMWKSRKSLIYKLSLYIDKKLLLESDWTVILTNKMRDILLNAYPDLNNKLSIIPCCVDTDRFVIRENNKSGQNLTFNGKFIFLYAGSFGTWYMLKEMLDFFKLAKETISNAHFLILTLSDHRDVKRAIEKNRLNLGDFTIVGVPPRKICDYVPLGNAALIFIKPTFSKLASSPTKFAEPLACGIPVIINSGIGDTQELIRKEKIGVIVDSFSGDDYKKAINELLCLLREGPALQGRCRNAAIKYFSLQDGASSYLRIYRSFFAKINLKEQL